MLVGIVGCPNSGKSTFFKSLTMANAEIANYPFTTIKPNHGVGHVISDCPCKRLKVKCNPQNSKCTDGKRMVPVRLVDVAGLVPGAHEGKGLGNQFLDDLRTGDGLIHVLDCSGLTNSEGKPAKGFDPMETVRMLENEIDFWTKSIIEKGLDSMIRTSQAEKIPLAKLLAKQLSGLGIKEGTISWAMKKAAPGTIEFVRELRKPVLLAGNKIDLPESRENLGRIEAEILPCSAASELALREAEEKGLIEYFPGDKDFRIIGGLSQKQLAGLEYIRKNVLEKNGSTGVQEALNRMVFGLLQMITVYPVADIGSLKDKKGNILPDAFLVRKGMHLREFAGMIHKEIGENFISGLNLRKQKIGADYILQDGDVVEILFRK